MSNRWSSILQPLVVKHLKKHKKIALNACSLLGASRREVMLHDVLVCVSPEAPAASRVALGGRGDRGHPSASSALGRRQTRRTPPPVPRTRSQRRTNPPYRAFLLTKNCKESEGWPAIRVNVTALVCVNFFPSRRGDRVSASTTVLVLLVGPYGPIHRAVAALVSGFSVGHVDGGRILHSPAFWLPLCPRRTFSITPHPSSC